jgi:hypothetical protein
MMHRKTMTRRGFALGLAAVPFLAGRGWSATSLPRMTVSKDPNCGCCAAWVDYLRAAGFSVVVTDTADIYSVKARLGVPQDLASCHTAEIGGYVIEGHVPEPTIRKLLAEKPAATGIAVPGMPQSVPGMDVPGANDTYDVILFGPQGRRRYARFQGRREI